MWETWYFHEKVDINSRPFNIGNQLINPRGALVYTITGLGVACDWMEVATKQGVS